MERAASSARLPEPQIKMGHTPSNRGLPTQGPYPAGNVTPFQQSLSLNQSPAGMRFLPPVQDRQIAHDYRQQAASSLRGQDDMSQLQYQDPRPLYREGLAVPPVNRQDHYLPYYNATNYGQPSPAAYSYGDHGLGHLNYRHPGHTQHDTEALSYGQNYYNPNQPSYNLGFDRQFQHQTGPERYPGTPSYPYQAAPQTRAASGYNDPRLHLQGQMPEYMHPSYIGAALPLGDPRNALYPGYGPLQNMESLQRSRQPTPERLRLQQFGAHQAYNVSSPSQQTLRSSAMHPVQQAKGGKPSMQHSRQPMYGNPIQKSPRSGYSGRMAVQQHPHVDVAPEPVPAAPTVPYRAGTDTMYPMSMGVLSSQYHDLTRNGRPSFEEASNKLPFIELARHVKPAEWGVLRIGNVCFTRRFERF